MNYLSIVCLLFRLSLDCLIEVVPECGYKTEFNCLIFEVMVQMMHPQLLQPSYFCLPSEVNVIMYEIVWDCSKKDAHQGAGNVNRI